MCIRDSHAGPEADNINSFQVFTRWGELVYQTQNFLPNDQEFGWDGTNNSQKLDTGVYIWMAEIHFIDGEKIVYSGDVALIR